MNVQPGARITIFDAVDRCTLLGTVARPELSHDGWVTDLIDDAEHGGEGGGAGSCDETTKTRA